MRERGRVVLWISLLALVLNSCASGPSRRVPAYEPYVFPVLECTLVCPDEYILVVRSNRTWWIVDHTISDYDKDKVRMGTWSVLDKSVFQFRRYGSRRPTGYLKYDSWDRSSKSWIYSRDQKFQRPHRVNVSDPAEVHILWNALDPLKDRIELAPQ